MTKSEILKVMDEEREMLVSKIILAIKPDDFTDPMFALQCLIDLVKLNKQRKQVEDNL